MMFKSSAILLTLTAALELVLASSVSITAPESKDIWEIGSTVQIKWDVNEAINGSISLLYASGPPQALTVNGLIAENVNAALGTYTWKVPSSIKPKKYVIEAGPSDKDLSFAGYITIKKPTKKPTKKTTKKATTKKTKKSTTKKVTKKTVTKKSVTKKPKSTKKPSAVCVGYPTKGEGKDDNGVVRCHSVPKAVSAQNNKKSTKKTKSTKKSAKKSVKKSTTKKSAKKSTTA
ncbi:hypothetical protein BD770DRAFT_388591 [Pilaira anomala]|nr:hypothetical protein BD770DRAFT_388591 [Pilaira anomala]